jgi:hypothetical protein
MDHYGSIVADFHFSHMNKMLLFNFAELQHPWFSGHALVMSHNANSA